MDNWAQQNVERLAVSYFGDEARWSYAAFRWINETLFNGDLPVPLITWQITPHGGCLGLTKPSDKPPNIVLHPSLLGTRRRGRSSPWSKHPAVLGERYALDTLIHETIHVSVHYLLGGINGPTSHNNSRWFSEVERIAPLLGIHGLVVGRKKSVRIPDPRAGISDDGVVKTVVRKRWVDGSVPYDAIATFPYGVRHTLDRSGSYYRSELPLPFDAPRIAS